MSAYRFRALILGLGLLPLAGCGDRAAEVSGTVQLKSQPLPTGVITFFPASGMPVAATISNGAYGVPNLPYGSYKVAVTALASEPSVVGGPGGPRKPTSSPGAPAAAAAPAEKGPQIPAKYGSVDTSGLTVTVDQSKVTFPVTLD